MKAVRWHARNDVRLENVDEPVVTGPTDVLLQIEACGICGSDLEEVAHGPVVIPVDEPHPLTGAMAPITLGHEFVGRVMSTGPDVDLRIGARVTATPIVWCGECDACRAGSIRRCADIGVVGLSQDGGLAELVRIDQAACVELPHDIAAWHGALVEPFAVAVHAFDGLEVAGRSVGIVGFGSVGASIGAIAQTMGAARIVAFDVNQRRSADASLRGFESARVDNAAAYDLDIVVEASGASTALTTCMAATRTGGTIVLVGLGAGSVPLPLKDAVYGEFHIVGRVGHELEELRHAAGLVSGRGVPLDPPPIILNLEESIDYLMSPREARVDGKVVVCPTK